MNAWNDPDFKGASQGMNELMVQKIQSGDKQGARELWEWAYNYWLGVKQVHAGIVRAWLVQKDIEQVLKVQRENGLESKVSCKKGCSDCCYQEVWITGDEADLLAFKIREGIEIDLERLKKQAQIQNTEAWLDIPKQDRKCVFLSDQNLCRVYDYRPISCRKYFVQSPPEMCADIRGKTWILAMDAAEAIATAAMNLPPEGGPLAATLLKKLVV